MNAGFYTYIHTRADDGKVFYVKLSAGKKGRPWSAARLAAQKGAQP